jgi:hypothetical protein
MPAKFRSCLLRALPAAALFLAASAWSGAASADVSSWIFVGYGPATVDDGDRGGWETDSMLALETGLGTPPTSPIIFGGMFKLGTIFTRGTDLGLCLRTATKGYVLGGWGAAIDLGGYERFWETGSVGGLGSLVLGAPWGITLSLSGGIGTNDARHASAVLGIDFARLTVYRQSGENWFMTRTPQSGTNVPKGSQPSRSSFRLSRVAGASSVLFW